MKLFENAENANKASEFTYNAMIQFCMEQGLMLNKDQIEALKGVSEACGANCCPPSDNSAVKDEEFKTEENSRDEEVIDAAKDDSTQKGAEPDPEKIEDAIEKEEKNDEFVNDYDQDVKKNESATYDRVLNFCIENGIILSSEGAEELKSIIEG